MVTEAAKAYHEKTFPGSHSTMMETDPEFMERFYNFAYDEVVNQDNLDDRTRYMAILATLLGCQGIGEFHCQMGGSIEFRRDPGGNQGDHLSGGCRFGHWKGFSLSGSSQ